MNKATFFMSDEELHQQEQWLNESERKPIFQKFYNWLHYASHTRFNGKFHSYLVKAWWYKFWRKHLTVKADLDDQLMYVLSQNIQLEIDREILETIMKKYETK